MSDLPRWSLITRDMCVSCKDIAPRPATGELELVYRTEGEYFYTGGWIATITCINCKKKFSSTSESWDIYYPVIQEVIDKWSKE